MSNHNHLNEIIARLGYANSPCLKYKRNNYEFLTLTAHTNKVLNALSPFAAYIADDEPFVLFFDEPLNYDEQKIINQKIWNAQIPIAIFCGTSAIKIFSGCTIDQRTCFLTEAETISFHAVDEIDENTPFSFWEIADHGFWEKYSQKFSGQKLNDKLLENLAYLTDKLRKGHRIPFANKLVLRLIFIRYLIDRGVNLAYPGFSYDVADSREALIALLNDSTDLYKLFAYLKGKFNGNLFEQDNENINDLTSAALGEIKDFLSADISTPSGQLSLFALYDFNLIPVELISNIYEILIGKEAQEKDNAFYTPKYLADYILDVTVDEHIERNETCIILDPSCGSGVFLVDSYRRMIEKKLDGALYTENDALLRDTLKKNIFGIDLNSDAIDVAIFSLYLAMLDYKNPKELQRFSLPDLKGSNLLVCDFFDETELQAMEGMLFDFIIGNPPWGSKNGRHMEYCRKHGYMQYMQNNDTCRAFIFRSKDFAQKNTMCCFVLHSTMLYMQSSPSRRFREYFLTNMKIKNIIELSSVRKLVFKNANAPAVVLSYKFSDTTQEGNRFEHISMKKNEFFRLFNIIVVEKTDVKSIQQKLLIENDWMWKTLVYGSTGDAETILKLKATRQTLEEHIISQSPPIIEGRGVEYNDGSRSAMLNAEHLLKRRLLKTRGAIHHFLLNEEYEYFEKKRIHRISNEALFHAPYCLVLQGVDTTDYTMKAVYVETDFVFREAVWALKGSKEQGKYLHNIVGLMNSNLYAYLNLMLGSFIGIEREKRQVGEVLSFPFVFSEDIARQVERIQAIQKNNLNFVASTDVSAEIDALNRMIIDAFGLSDNEFVDYALRIQIPQLTGKNDYDAKRKATVNDYELYGKRFYDFLSGIFVSSGKHIRVNAYPTIAKHYSAVEIIVKDEKPTEWFTIVDTNTDKQKTMFANLSAYKTSELFYTVKDVLYFEERSFYIIKPHYYRNWHPAIAKLDLMEATDQILSRKTGGEQ